MLFNDVCLVTIIQTPYRISGHRERNRASRRGFESRKLITMDTMPAGKMQESRELAQAVAAEIRATLARQNMLIKDLARQSGISQGYLGKRLRDEAPLNLNDIQAICEVFGKDVLAFISTAIEASQPDAGRSRK